MPADTFMLYVYSMCSRTFKAVYRIKITKGFQRFEWHFVILFELLSTHAFSRVSTEVEGPPANSQTSGDTLSLCWRGIELAIEGLPFL